jgi:hypothetical protein
MTRIVHTSPRCFIIHVFAVQGADTIELWKRNAISRRYHFNRTITPGEIGAITAIDNALNRAALAKV